MATVYMGVDEETHTHAQGAHLGAAVELTEHVVCGVALKPNQILRLYKMQIVLLRFPYRNQDTTLPVVPLRLALHCRYVWGYVCSS